jgi:hypothetical protein
MAYTDPTAATIKARFPEFASVDDAVIDEAIGEAGLWVDTSWPEAVYTIAKNYVVAHLLTVQGQGTSAQAQVASVGDFTRIKSGDLEVSRSGAASAATGGAAAVFGGTTYGVQYLQLLARYKPAPMLI